MTEDASIPAGTGWKIAAPDDYQCTTCQVWDPTLVQWVARRPELVGEPLRKTRVYRVPECYDSKLVPRSGVGKSGVPDVERQVCYEILERQRMGVAKYGTTLADNNLSLRAWLQHALEECLDQALYLRRAISEIDKANVVVEESRE